MTSRRPSTRTLETVEKRRCALGGEEKAVSEVHRAVFVASVLKKGSVWKAVGCSLRVIDCAGVSDKCPRKVREQRKLCQ